MTRTAHHPQQNQNSPTSKIFKKSRIKIWATTFTAYALTILPTLAANELSWTDSSASSNDVTGWIKKVMMVIMAIFIMVAIVTGSLAFKQLAADGNWKDFWSKIAGSIGMFVVPVVVYYLVGL